MANISLPNIGSEIKLILQADKIDNHRLSEYDWSLDLYCSSNKIVTIPKESCIKQDEDSFSFILDISNVGYGRLYATLYAKIPDSHLDDNIRDEVSSIYTGIIIKKLGTLLNVTTDSSPYLITTGGCLQFRLSMECSTGVILKPEVPEVPEVPPSIDINNLIILNITDGQTIELDLYNQIYTSLQNNLPIFIKALNVDGEVMVNDILFTSYKYDSNGIYMGGIEVNTSDNPNFIHLSISSSTLLVSITSKLLSDIHPEEISYIRTTGSTVYVDNNTVTYWDELAGRDPITVYVNSNKPSDIGYCELWVNITNVKPISATYIPTGVERIFWKDGKEPQFDFNKTYKIRFDWDIKAGGICVASWTEYSSYQNKDSYIPITVMTLNIKTAYTNDAYSWSSRKQSALGFLSGNLFNADGYKMPKFDIAGLQEIWMSGGSQWNDIQSVLSDEYASIIANRGDSNSSTKDSEACAILYRKDRFTRVSGGFFWLRGGGWNGDTGDYNKEGFATWDANNLSSHPGLTYDNYKRIAVWIILRDNSTGKEFFVLNTHYNAYFYSDGKTAASTPYYSSELVKSRIDALSGGRPVIFLGDLNCNPDKPPIGILKPTYYPMHDTRDIADEVVGQKYTMNGWAEEDVSPTYALFDYIFVKGDWKVNMLNVLNSKMDNGEWISDHNPVVADLFLKL